MVFVKLIRGRAPQRGKCLRLYAMGISMQFKKFLVAIAATSLALIGNVSSAATITSVDLTPQDGTSFDTINNTPVRIDFGPLYGMGTIAVNSIGGGYFRNIVTPYTANSRYTYSTTLSNGNVLNTTPTGTGVFQIGSPQPTGLSGFDLTFTLDKGSFKTGSAFIVGSLDQRGDGRYQAFSPGSAFSAADSVALYTDGQVPMTVIGNDANGPLYGAPFGISDSRAFTLLRNTNSFTVKLLQTPNLSGGINFSLALPSDPQAVPEPATWAMMIVGFGFVGGLLRRRHSLSVCYA